ncbi:hypothetical protein ELG83_23235 [Rhizobium leguminosarum]|uniref:Uncharacterized protein n=1 Tax=Rhizobium leguminosarum bv. viciae TaxID=387 RepID=A0A8G2J3A9_RHILV|nr:hypothetical protein [Rhizobium leguminosarum]NKK04403.1 hypothetical protein [Rhizobium leguminosarum bv. viciae]QIO68401.1 hypothetical protein HA462_17000 [Rhizobium leguminosarum bv. trifolii]MBY5341563.1 hypothetical protein [Rhizobium leguminosarum]MBY5377180.1 hypothetical protein [Rhizobium leguminosarum]
MVDISNLSALEV